MKRVDLLRQIARRARVTERSWTLVREGANHEIWECGKTRVPIPRHRDINELTAQAIRRLLEPELGKEWWQ